MVEFGDQDISGLIEPEDSQKTDADIFIEEQKRKSEEKEDDSQKKKDAKIFGKIISGILVADALKYLIKQSKIIGMVLENIAKALGLLIDLLLMPFLPIIVWAIVGMYRAVLGIWSWWKEHLSPTGTQPNVPTIDLPQSGLKAKITDFMNGVAAALIAGLVAALLAVAGVSLGWTVVAAAIVGLITFAIASFLSDLAYKLGEFLGPLIVEAGRIIGQFAYDAGVAFGTLLQDVYKNITTFIVTVRSTLESGLKLLPQMVKGILNNLYNIVYNGFKTVANAVIWIVNQMLGAIRGVPLVGSMVPSNIPYLDRGGTIEKTGVAVVHEGETVSKGGNTYNFYGYDDVALQKKIKSILRQGGAGYRV